MTLRTALTLYYGAVVPCLLLALIAYVRSSLTPAFWAYGLLMADAAFGFLCLSCPNCHRHLNMRHLCPKYCEHCGAEIDWEREIKFP